MCVRFGVRKWKGFHTSPGSQNTVTGGGAGPRDPWFSFFVAGCPACLSHVCTNQQVGLVTFPRSLVISSGAGWGHAMRFLLQQLDRLSGGPVARSCPSLAVRCCAILVLGPTPKHQLGRGGSGRGGCGRPAKAKAVSNNKTKWPNHCTTGKKPCGLALTQPNHLYHFQRGISVNICWDVMVLLHSCYFQTG